MSKASSAAPDLRALAQAGAEALRAGDARKARALFEQVAATGRADASIWLGVALASRALGDDAAKLTALDRTLALDGRNLRALIMQADHLAAAGDARAASAFYTAAIRAAPPMSQLPPEVRTELERAQVTAARYGEAYEVHLRSQLAARGFDAARTSSRFARSIDLLTGRKQVYVQQPLYYYFPELPQVQFYDRQDFPWLDAVEAAADDIRNELLAVLQEEGAFVPYVQGRRDRPAQKYDAMLNNPSWSAFFLWQDGAVVEGNAARCPRTLAALADAPLCRIPRRTPSILFSLLRPGARIPPHHGMINTRLICHLPLIVPPGCGFRVGNETRSWEEGRAWVFDDSIEHEAWNGSAQTRVILLFDVWRPELSPGERESVAAMFEAIDEFGAAPRWEI